MNNDLNYQMLRIRMVEMEISRRYKEGKMRCPVHLSVGQEAAAVGVCAALKPEDKMVSTHRGHAHYLAKGGSIKGLIAELYGNGTGCSKGYGGSMHLIDLAHNFWGSTSIVGGTIPYGVGLAFADRLKGKSTTTVICIGDSAIEEGVFHESANFAALHQLNVIFFCENNQYSCFTHIDQRQPKRKDGFRKIAMAHEMGYHYCTYRVEDIEKTVRQAKQSMPAFVEVPTWRFLQHCGPDPDDHLNYRNQWETAAWKKNDQVKADQMAMMQILPEINEAFEFAESSPNPEQIGEYAD